MLDKYHLGIINDLLDLLIHNIKTKIKINTCLEFGVGAFKGPKRWILANRITKYLNSAKIHRCIVKALEKLHLFQNVDSTLIFPNAEMNLIKKQTRLKVLKLENVWVLKNENT